MKDRLPDKIDNNARVEIRVNGVVVGTRRIVDFIGSLTGTDDGTNDKVTLTLSVDGGGDPTEFWEFIAGVLQVRQAAISGATEVYISPNDAFTTFLDLVEGSVALTSSGNVTVAAQGGAAGFTGRDEVSIVSSANDVTITAAGTINFTPTLDTLLANTGVVAGSYGTSVKVPRITVDAKGRISAVSELSTPATTSVIVPPTAPADASISPGEAVFWRSGDSLRIKAKAADGTVKSLTLGTLT